MSEREFELLLLGDEKSPTEIVRWSGKDGEDAARRYVDCHRDASVIAWREIAHGLFIGAPTNG
jgi:hypothetical protein